MYQQKFEGIFEFFEAEWNLIKNTSDYFSELFEAFAPILTNASHQHQVSIVS